MVFVEGGGEEKTAEEEGTTGETGDESGKHLFGDLVIRFFIWVYFI